jgi:DNA polymerase III alpha subunit
METVGAELWAMGLSVGKHPTEFVRAELHRQGVVTAADLRGIADRSVIEVAGVVTHRQQPATAKGTVFLNLEDETGLMNIICAKGVWKRFRTVARGAPALRVRGVLEKHQGVINIVAGRITRLPISLADGLRLSWRHDDDDGTGGVATRDAAKPPLRGESDNSALYICRLACDRAGRHLHRSHRSQVP